MNTIVLTGGGTAGHVIPAVALLPQLEAAFDRIIYIGSGGVEKKIAAKYGLQFYEVESAGFNRSNMCKNIKIPFVLAKGIKEAKEVLLKEKPKIIFSKGGFVALPAIFAAKRLDIPVVAHESDLSVGLANKIAVKLGATLLTAFPDTAVQNIDYIFTGFPLRKELFYGNAEKAKQELKLTSNKPVLLVVGGSLGSTAVNEAVKTALPILLKNYNVVHITGNNNLVKTEIPGYYPIGYSDNIADLYALANIVISRAGAGAVSELSALKKSVVFIPLPAGASRGDQLQNAEYSKKYGAEVLLQQDITTPSLLTAIEKAKLKQMQPFSPFANDTIVNILTDKAGMR